MVTNFWTKIARPITGFVRTIAIASWLWRVVWEVGRQNADIADDIAPKGRCQGNHFLAFYIWGAH